MIKESLAAFIWAQTELQGAGLGLKAAYAKTPDTTLGELPAPFALVTQGPERPQELWLIGDAQRKENTLPVVSFVCVSREQADQFRARFQRLIESAFATDVAGSVPGIDYVAYADLLRDSGDQKTYFSDQPSWFAAPTPVVYKNEDANGEPVIVVGGYSVDLAAGSITFAVANAAPDRIRAAYKMGTVDFNIAGVADFETASESDIANNPARFVVAFTLEPHFLIKTNANKYL